LFGGERDRRPQVHDLSKLAPELKARRHDAYDGVAFVIERDVFVDQTPVAPEAALPESVTEHHDLIFTRLILFGQEDPSELRAGAERAEEIMRDGRAVQPFGIAPAGQVETPSADRRH